MTFSRKYVYVLYVLYVLGTNALAYGDDSDSFVNPGFFAIRLAD